MKIDGKISYAVPFGKKHMHDPDYLKWLRDYEVMKTINRPEYLKPIPFKEVKKYCESVMNSKHDIFSAIYDKEDDAFIGTLRIKLDPRAKNADIGILVGDRSRWGKGIATDIISAASAHLFTKMKMRKLTAGAMAVNAGMIRVFERLGFKREGILRKHDAFESKYCDHIYFGCFKNEFKNMKKGKR